MVELQEKCSSELLEPKCEIQLKDHYERLKCEKHLKYQQYTQQLKNVSSQQSKILKNIITQFGKINSNSENQNERELIQLQDQKPQIKQQLLPYKEEQVNCESQVDMDSNSSEQAQQFKVEKRSCSMVNNNNFSSKITVCDVSGAPPQNSAGYSLPQLSQDIYIYQRLVSFKKKNETQKKVTKLQQQAYNIQSKIDRTSNKMYQRELCRLTRLQEFNVGNQILLQQPNFSLHTSMYNPSQMHNSLHSSSIQPSIQDEQGQQIQELRKQLKNQKNLLLPQISYKNLQSTHNKNNLIFSTSNNQGNGSNNSYFKSSVITALANQLNANSGNITKAILGNCNTHSPPNVNITNFSAINNQIHQSHSPKKPKQLDTHLTIQKSKVLPKGEQEVKNLENLIIKSTNKNASLQGSQYNFTVKQSSSELASPLKDCQKVQRDTWKNQQDQKKELLQENSFLIKGWSTKRSRDDDKSPSNKSFSSYSQTMKDLE